METTQSMTSLIAQQLMALCPDDITWDIQGEVADMREYAQQLIGIVHVNSTTEEVYANRTMRLEATLSGQILVESMDNDTIRKHLDDLQTALYQLIGSYRYTEVGDAVVIQGTCDGIVSVPKGNYWEFDLPFNVVVQF